MHDGEIGAQYATGLAAEFMSAFLSLPPSPLGLHAFVERFSEKAGNLTRGLSSGRVRVIQGVARAIA
jgi:sarcosine/dimethylglycine N-methyltransferase